jgi:hypothetical protein
MCRQLFYAASLIFAGALPGAAQPPATTVQLPTFSLFTVNTTVSVPDGGGVFLGGVNRAASGRIERGMPGVPFRNRGIGSARSASGMHVTATIIDHKEMDEAILAEAAARRGGAPLVVDKPVTIAGDVIAGGRGPGRASASAGDLSVAEIRRQQAAVSDTQSVEGLAYLAKAEQAARKGKPGLAKVYFRMAASRLKGDAAQQARQRTASLADD